MTHAVAKAASHPAADTVFELRRYALEPGRRDTLIAIFDAEFVETQEAAGMSVVGQFRDAAQPDHFVWFRGFPDQCGRTAALGRDRAALSVEGAELTPTSRSRIR